MSCQLEAQMAGKNAILAQGMFKRRLKRSNSTMLNATVDDRDDNIHREMMEREVDERACIEGRMWERVDAIETPKSVP
jgi:hypothetical protein